MTRAPVGRGALGIAPAVAVLIGGVAAAGCGGAPPPPAAPVVSARPVTRAPVAEEPDDEVAVHAEHGHVEPAAVEAGLAPHRDALTGCYTQRVGRRRWLGGRLTLRWEVAGDGRIDRVLLAASDLGAWPVEKCVLDIAREVSFGAPVSGAAEVELPLEFSLCQHTAGGCTTRGLAAIWDEDASVKAVGPQLAKLDACGKGRATPEDVRITLYVGPRGRVLSVGFATSAGELVDAWAACAEKAALAWRVADPRGQIAKLAVRYRPR